MRWHFASIGPNARPRPAGQLNLLEIPAASAAVQGVVMELNDCAFATLNKITANVRRQ